MPAGARVRSTVYAGRHPRPPHPFVRNRSPMANVSPATTSTAALVAAAGRKASEFGIEGRLSLAQLAPDQWAGELAAWRAMRGVTHLCVDTMRMGLSKPEQHVEMLRRFKDAAMG